jgi:hypothetical protein
MTPTARKRIFFIAASVMVSLIALLAILYKPETLKRRTPHPGPHQKQLIVGAIKARTQVTQKPAHPKPLLNIDPEAHDPKLRAEHHRLLRSRPLEQHLPYRDREIGADLVNVTTGGKLVLLITYIHSQAAARADIERLMAHYHDSGGAYVIRYEQVFK